MKIINFIHIILNFYFLLLFEFEMNWEHEIYRKSYELRSKNSSKNNVFFVMIEENMSRYWLLLFFHITNIFLRRLLIKMAIIKSKSIYINRERETHTHVHLCIYRKLIVCFLSQLLSLFKKSHLISSLLIVFHS